MLLCRVIVPLVYCTGSHCFLLPPQCIASSFLAICQLSAPHLFQHNFTCFLLEYLGFGSILILFCKQIIFFLPGHVSEYPLIGKRSFNHYNQGHENSNIFSGQYCFSEIYLFFSPFCRRKKVLCSIFHRPNNSKKTHVVQSVVIIL